MYIHIHAHIHERHARRSARAHTCIHVHAHIHERHDRHSARAHGWAVPRGGALSCICAREFIHVCTYAWAVPRGGVRSHIYVHVHVHMYAHMHGPCHVAACALIYMCMYMYTCMHIYMGRATWRRALSRRRSCAAPRRSRSRGALPQLPRARGSRSSGERPAAYMHTYAHMHICMHAGAAHAGGRSSGARPAAYIY